MAAVVDQVTDADDDRPARRRGWLLPTLTVLALTAAGTGCWMLVRDSDSAAAGDSDGPSATTEVTRTTISASEEWGGTLGHGSATGVNASSGGTVTRLADEESTVRRGTELYSLNERPVVALYGKLPMYRELASSATGADVRQLESNLAELGYDGFDVDNEFTDYTALAVQEWQDDLGMDETGVVAPSDVVFLPGRGRVDSVTAEVGDTIAPGSEVLRVTGSDQIVDLEVEVSDRDLVRAGTDVTVSLPGGREVPGRVTSSTVVEDQGSGSGALGDDEAAGADDTVTDVEVTLAKNVDNSLLGSPVDVVVTVDERKNVLVVPISALLALSEGGFGVELVAGDGTTSLVPVETGLFSDGTVEVSGKGIDKGTVVGVAGA